jgi:CRISPR-associated exonuclease Cas4
VTDPIPISALQHYLFCPRQCALVHVDRLWAENRLTAQGSLLHHRAHRPGFRTRPPPNPRRPHGHAPDAEPTDSPLVRTERALPLLSERLGLAGVADCVEFPLRANGSPAGPPRPVEHKRGRPKRIAADRVQLCAQALCLEEMLFLAAGSIAAGELFYHAVRRRERVVFDAELRTLTVSTIRTVHELIASNSVPRVERAPKCRDCSLIDLCLPAGTGPTRTPRLYLSRALAASLAAGPGSDSSAATG